MAVACQRAMASPVGCARGALRGERRSGRCFRAPGMVPGASSCGASFALSRRGEYAAAARESTRRAGLPLARASGVRLGAGWVVRDGEGDARRTLDGEYARSGGEAAASRGWPPDDTCPRSKSCTPPELPRGRSEERAGEVVGGTGGEARRGVRGSGGCCNACQRACHVSPTYGEDRLRDAVAAAAPPASFSPSAAAAADDCAAPAGGGESDSNDRRRTSGLRRTALGGVGPTDRPPPPGVPAEAERADAAGVRGGALPRRGESRTIPSETCEGRPLWVSTAVKELGTAAMAPIA